jgi:hypothetical protein
MPFKFNSQKFCWKLKIKSLTKQRSKLSKHQDTQKTSNLILVLNSKFLAIWSTQMNNIVHDKY